MAVAIFSLFLLFLYAVFIVTTAQISNSSKISKGSSLSPASDTTKSWLSSSGQFAFGFYKEGNGFALGIWFTGNNENTVIWTLNNNPPLFNNSSLLFTGRGRLVLTNLQGTEINIAFPLVPVSSASMLDSGNLVMYNYDSEIVWNSFVDLPPTDTLVPGQTLLAGQALYSSKSATDHSTGRYMLAMQEDGHLVQYPDAYWASGTWGHINVSLNLEEDGHLFLMQGSNGGIIMNITNGFSANGPMFCRLTLDVDGIFRLYSHTLDRNSNWSIIWASSDNGCLAPGLCGLNGYCSTNPTDKKEAACDCLPGFDFIDPTQRTLGCKSNFSSEDCTNKSNHIYYSIDTLRNVVWKNESYSTLQFQAESDCKHNCLEDCNCDVAIFKNGECRKHRFPLKSGRRNPDDPITTLVKVRNESLVSPKDDDIPYTKGPVFNLKGKKELHKDILIISVAFISFVFIIVAVSCVLIYRYRVWRYKKMKDNQHNTELTEEIVLRSFTYDELVKATNNFKEEVGRGAFGTVFKGALDLLNGQRLIAVKRLERVVDEGEREFRTEMKVIGRTHHKNLVRLLGYCYDQFHRLLVYEYMSNGSLADLLFKSEVRPYWDERVGIALDIAKGMLYLHEECETQIIHCDIKPQNILMDEHRTAKISDFGLSKLLKQDQTRTFTKIRGTRGYVAPEWHRNLPITLKADVFSFGVVLLEIICCRRSVDTNFPEDEVVLMDWVYDSFEDGELSKLVGDEEVDKRKLERMVKVGIWCIQGEPSLRPSMKKVVLMLEGILDVPVPPSSSSLN